MIAGHCRLGPATDVDRPSLDQRSGLKSEGEHGVQGQFSGQSLHERKAKDDCDRRPGFPADFSVSGRASSAIRTSLALMRARRIFLSSELISSEMSRLQCWQFVWNPLRIFCARSREYLRAFRAFDFYFFIDHEPDAMRPKCAPKRLSLSAKHRWG
jgi:hypothetical protein